MTDKEIEDLGDALHAAWCTYRKNFGYSPHGTPLQCRALAVFLGSEMKKRNIPTSPQSMRIGPVDMPATDAELAAELERSKAEYKAWKEGRITDPADVRRFIDTKPHPGRKKMT